VEWCGAWLVTDIEGEVEVVAWHGRLRARCASYVVRLAPGALRFIVARKTHMRPSLSLAGWHQISA
jgi:hypothetical protein